MIKSINYTTQDESNAWNIYKKELENMRERLLLNDNRKIKEDVTEYKGKVRANEKFQKGRF